MNILKLNDEEYSKAEGVRKSELDWIAKSPFHYKYYKDCISSRTKAMEFGSLVHALVLEPDKVDEMIERVPKGTRKTKIKSEKIIISEQDYSLAQALAFNLLDRDPIQKLLNHGLREHSFFSEHWDSKLKVKCKADYVDLERKIIVDLKTTESASTSAFAYSIKQYRYGVQAAFYADIVSWATGIEIDTFCFIAVEKSPPFAHTLFEISGPALEQGREQYEQNLMTLAECLKTNNWPSYNKGNVFGLGGLL